MEGQLSSRNAPYKRVSIDRLSKNGSGIASLGGVEILVNGVLPNETVEIGRIRKKKGKKYADLVNLISRSPDRALPICEVYERCGGCSLQHLNYESQLKLKQSILINHLLQHEVTPPDNINVISNQSDSYRRRARLGVRFVPKKGGVLVGFREPNSGFITPIKECPVIERSFDHVLPKLSGLVEALNEPGRIPQIELSIGTNNCSLIFRHLYDLSEGDIAALHLFGEITNVIIFTQRGSPENLIQIYPDKPALLDYSISKFDIQVEFGPTDFIQINDDVNQKIIKLIFDWLNPTKSDGLLDLFCGVGNFSLPAAKLCGVVHGVENNLTLVKQAIHNARLNGLQNVTFEAFDLYSNDIAEWRINKYSKVLIDPPRSGALDVLRKIVSTVSPDMIGYISCNPESLAIDSKYLIETGAYKLTKMSMADMFPHTTHIETVALFEKV